MYYLQAVILAFLALSLMTFSYAAEPVSPTFDQQKLAEDIGGLKAGQQSLHQQINDLKFSIEKRIDDTKNLLKGSIDDTSAWLRVIFGAIVGIFAAIATGAIALWKQLGAIEGRVSGIQPNVELLWKLRPEMERLIELRPQIEHVTSMFEDIIEQSKMQELNIDRLLRDQQEVLRQVRDLTNRLSARGL
jgi:chromosome segregation ATPase